jgi:predicted nucleic acid-binding protein
VRRLIQKTPNGKKLKFINYRFAQLGEVFTSKEQDNSTSRDDKASYWYHKILDSRDLGEEVLRVAIQLEITAYDSSYIALVGKHSLTLLTESEKLRVKRKKPVEAVSLEYARSPSELIILLH